IANVLDRAAQLDPSKIIAKMKYHLLVHAVEDIRRFGPIVGVATEGYESFNLIFRYCSILSNHISPSRDIAHQLARQEAFRHTISSGWYKTEDGNWKQPGQALRAFVAKASCCTKCIIYGQLVRSSDLWVSIQSYLPIQRSFINGYAIRCR
ncbi:hypothetical protein FA15DRAFT_604646, partial [Coprinopsis marcescibilis]